MSTYAIGDVQGCHDELIALLDKISYQPAKDTLWFAGDLINRGPKSLETLRFIKSLPQSRVRVVLGNHDLYFLSLAAGVKTEQNKDTLSKALNAPDIGELCDWLKSQPLVHHDPALAYTMVHAGIHPWWDLNKALSLAAEVSEVLKGPLIKEFLKKMYGNKPTTWNDNHIGWKRLRFITNCFTRMRFCTHKGDLNLTAKFGLNESGETLMPWFRFPEHKMSGDKIVFGHWAALEGKTYQQNALNIDTGCVWGGYLTALRLEDEERFSVPSNKRISQDMTSKTISPGRVT